MTVYQLDDDLPQVAASAWIAENATVLGRVSLAEDTSVWFGAVLRGDGDLIAVGRGSNIQDNAVLHTDEGFPIALGENVTVGHQAMLHGCTIGSGSLIGIGAIVLNGAKIGCNSLVGAGALVTAEKEFPDGSLIIGSPATAVRPLTPQQIERLHWSARHYIENAQRLRSGLKKIA